MKPEDLPMLFGPIGKEASEMKDMSGIEGLDDAASEIPDFEPTKGFSISHI